MAHIAAGSWEGDTAWEARPFGSALGGREGILNEEIPDSVPGHWGATEGAHTGGLPGAHLLTWPVQPGN